MKTSNLLPVVVGMLCQIAAAMWLMKAEDCSPCAVLGGLGLVLVCLGLTNAHSDIQELREVADQSETWAKAVAVQNCELLEQMRRLSNDFTHNLGELEKRRALVRDLRHRLSKAERSRDHGKVLPLP